MKNRKTAADEGFNSLATHSLEVQRLRNEILDSQLAPVAANDNSWPTALSRDNLMAESLLSQTDLIEPRQSLPTGLVLVAVLFLVAISPLFLLAF